MFPKALDEDANAFCMKAREYDLLLVPGDTFGCPGYFRISYCVETEKVKRSLPALKNWRRLTKNPSGMRSDCRHKGMEPLSGTMPFLDTGVIDN